MNHSLRFRKARNAKASSMMYGSRDIRITRIPESNIIDLRPVETDVSNTPVSLSHIAPPLPKMTAGKALVKPQAQQHMSQRKVRNFLFGFSWKRVRTPKHEAPPVPTVIAKEPPPPSLVDEQFVTRPFGWARSLAGFSLAACALMIPLVAASNIEKIETIQGRVLGASTEAYQHLEDAQRAVASSQYSSATQSFKQAEEQFRSAQDELNGSSSLLGEVVKVIPHVDTAQRILNAGSDLSLAGQYISEALSSVQSSVTAATFVRQLEGFSSSLQDAGGAVERAEQELRQVNLSYVPAEHRERLQKILDSLPQLQEFFRDFTDAKQVMDALLGVNETSRILLLFQNNAELRPTGGFIGSLALLDIDEGIIKNMEVPEGGAYDIAGQLRSNVISPTPLHLINPHWNIQDANWFPDFPTSARKVTWFYERSGGPSVDAVLALTPSVVESFLDMTGPIQLPAFEVTVTSENVRRLAQDSEQQDPTKPKRFISELFPILLNKLFSLSGDQFLPLVDSITQAFESKNILLAFTDPNDQRAVVTLGWDGGVRQSPQDYLMVVHTNIGGGKTDRLVDTFVSLTTTIKDDDTITQTLSIQRTHTGAPLDGQQGVRNVDYIRTYVPAGSILLEARGFDRIPGWRFQTPESDATLDPDVTGLEGTLLVDEVSGTRITQEFGKTVFGNWIDVGPGESRTATFVYQLPFKFEKKGTLSQLASYSLLMQKQPGVEYTAFIQKLYIPEAYETIWHDNRMSQETGYLLISEELSTDKFFGLVARKK